MRAEIVGARIGTKITNSPKIIAAAVELDAVIEFLDRPRMRFMAAADFGSQWNAMALGPTLFIAETNERGEIINVYPPRKRKDKG
jgi:hypothetical protein